MLMTWTEVVRHPCIENVVQLYVHLICSARYDLID
jgi:hypothetical protein